MLPIVHNIYELPASELERFFRSHPEPLVRALAERLEESEAELERLSNVEDELAAAEERAEDWQEQCCAARMDADTLHDQLCKLADEYAKLEHKLNERKHSA